MSHPYPCDLFVLGRYCENNAGKFSHEDTCYVLAFSTIMLNTSLHNPSVKDKVSQHPFCMLLT